jgi:hypothetical protein
MSIEAMKQALEALVRADRISGHPNNGKTITALRAAIAEASEQRQEMKFNLGDTVRKVSGSQWKGTVVGTYSTELTPEGYAVESSTEKGSVQIYPAKALELVASAVDEAMQRLTDVQQEMEQEPVAWIYTDAKGRDAIIVTNTAPYEDAIPLYTSLPRREWVGLTDDEKAKLDDEYGDDILAHLDAIEAKLKEKNS